MAASIEFLKTRIGQEKAQLKLTSTQLAALEKQLYDLENPVEMRTLSYNEMKKRVIEMETRKDYMRSWKKVNQDGLLKNILSIMNEDTYHAYLEVHVEKNATIEQKSAAKQKSMNRKTYLGPFGGLMWQLFILQIIKNLHSSGSFWNHEDSFNTFEDTAGGCDEILWEEGATILNNSIE